MCNRFNQTCIQIECVFNQLFAVSGNSRSADFDAVACRGIDFLQFLEDNLHRISAV